MNASEWYAALEKPFFAPPTWVYGSVWSVLFLLIALTLSYAFAKILTKQWPASLATPFLLNFASALALWPILFDTQSTLLALIDSIVILGSLLWMIRILWTRSRWLAYVQIPYLLWALFEMVVQGGIMILNF